MRTVLIYVAGIITGVILTIIVAAIMIPSNQNSKGSNSLYGATMFDEPTESIHDKSFKVIQVIRSNVALVQSPGEYGGYYGTLYLLKNDEGHYYYDDEIVKVPKGKVVRQIGIYNYTAKSGDKKTVPIISIMD